jgi:hypothetical protein
MAPRLSETVEGGERENKREEERGRRCCYATPPYLHCTSHLFDMQIFHKNTVYFRHNIPYIFV